MSSQEQVVHALERSCLGHFWDYACTGSRPCVSDADSHALISMLKERASDLDCAETHEVIMLIDDLHAERVRRSHHIARICNCPTIHRKISLDGTILTCRYIEF